MSVFGLGLVGLIVVVVMVGVLVGLVERWRRGKEKFERSFWKRLRNKSARVKWGLAGGLLELVFFPVPFEMW